jgi:cytochrome d ubiquinol oxidase subunit II
MASTITPVLLGVVIGALSTGAVGEAAGRVGAASFVEVFVRPWLASFPILVGLLALTLFAFLAAVYLALAASDESLREDFRRRGLAAATAVFVVALAGLLLAPSQAPRMGFGLTGAPWSLVLHLATGAAAITAIVALWRRRYLLARNAAAAQVSCILWGWALAQYPFLVPPTLSIRQASAPDVTLKLLLWGLGIGAAVLIPSLVYLFRTFSDATTSDAASR